MEGFESKGTRDREELRKAALEHTKASTGFVVVNNRPDNKVEIEVCWPTNTILECIVSLLQIVEELRRQGRAQVAATVADISRLN